MVVCTSAWRPDRPPGHALGDARPAELLERETLAAHLLLEVAGIPVPSNRSSHETNPADRISQLSATDELPTWPPTGIAVISRDEAAKAIGADRRG